MIGRWRRAARDLRGRVEPADAGVRHDEGAVSCGGALVYGGVHGGDVRAGDCVWAGVSVNKIPLHGALLTKGTN